jgi:hypothetical protein
MGRRGFSDQKQVQLTVFGNEPEARMAEQRLFQEGILCVTRSLGGGPGLWGTAYNLPHGVYVYEEDATRARELLGLDADGVTPGDRSSRGPELRTGWGWVALVIVIALTLVIAGPTLARMFGG